MLPKSKRWERPGYLKWIATLPCANCGKLEKEVHQYLRKYQVKGEWFKVSEDLATNTIKELTNESFNHAVAS